MSLSINTNIEAVTAHLNLVKTGNEMSAATEKLSTGLRSNDAADDAVINDVSSATFAENLQASNSSVRDVAVAAELAEHTKLQVLDQAQTAVLAQANTTPAAVLKMLH